MSKEAQAIIGGVVGFWGGVFGMGSVYLLVVCLRRIRKQVQNQRNNGPMLIDKVSNNCIEFLSSFADFSILLTYICKKKIYIKMCGCFSINCKIDHQGKINFLPFYDCKCRTCGYCNLD